MDLKEIQPEKVVIYCNLSDLETIVNKIVKDNTSDNKEERLIPRKEVAKILGVTLQTLYNWECNGMLVPVKIGRNVYYEHSAIDKMGDRK